MWFNYATRIMILANLPAFTKLKLHNTSTPEDQKPEPLMNKFIFLFLFAFSLNNHSEAQANTPITYKKSTHLIPMRDGIKLFTVVYSPVNGTGPWPILIQRTPYGADKPPMYDPSRQSYTAALARDGYIFVFQDIRGKFKSEGVFEMNRALYHVTDKTKTDESTDAYDAVDWLVKNIPDNNGKAGIFGISYDGFTALDAACDPHPALKASSPQASPADMFLGDDFHHNGAFRLSYGFEYSYLVENSKEENSSFPFPQFDLFDWYLHLGSLKNVNEKYYHNRLPSWNSFAAHPNYDAFWKNQSALTHMQYAQIPVLHVGGYYDQEDLNGPQIMYEHLEKKDSAHRNYLLLGPWNHGGWAGAKGDSLGKISFENKTSAWFQDLQKKWFDYWLKGLGDGKFAEANCFQTGTNQWKSYETWPPKEAEIRKLYTYTDGSCGFSRPTVSTGAVQYISDPAHPVPYRTQPIEATYGRGSRWYTWQVEDQRFVSSRPDVLSFTMDSLQEDLTITGKVTAHLFVSTTASDADFVVKLIDVYPGFDRKSFFMSGYQLPVTMEVFRGRFRKGLDKAVPFVPGRPEEITIDLHQVNHSFLKGHKIMIQVQSTWFPLIDRNPQKFVPNIFEARESDFIKATHSLYCNKNIGTYLELPVMK
jgi:putative CocE/NonD family hydrolase